MTNNKKEKAVNAVDSLGLDTLASNPKNPRKEWRDDDQREAFRKSLKEFGDLSGIVFNTTSGHLVGGHKRLAEFKEDSAATKSVELILPSADEAGTLAYGYVVLSTGTRFAYREVKWNDQKEKAAMIAANRWSAEWDFPALNEILTELSTEELPFDLEITGFDGAIPPMGDEDGLGMQGDSDESSENTESAYTGKVVVPIYTPTGDKPKVAELAGLKKYNQFIEEIESAQIDDQEVADFLKFAASRHIVFDYGKVAEYYAHAPKEVQRLMENSALVLVDFNRAVELGYVRLTERVKALYAQDHSDELSTEDTND
jgi:hypothetical protein